jgi:hypothetical protein
MQHGHQRHGVSMQAYLPDWRSVLCWRCDWRLFIKFGSHLMKIALIGAGSAVFAQRMITDILAIDGLDAGTFALVDLDTERLELAHAVAEQTITSAGKSLTVYECY